MSRIPVVLLTGFLGSGKTTLLSQLLTHPEFSDTALVINEFGEVSIDHLVVADLAENIVELRDGCLCCTIRGDLVFTLRDLYQKRVLDEIPRFNRVIVETSGLADPVPLVHTLMANPPLQQGYRLDAVVTVVDGEHGLATIAGHETAASQAALADLLLVSKTDAVDARALAELKASLRTLNVSAEIVEAAHGRIEPSRLLDRALFHPQRSGAGIERWLAGAHDHDHDHHGTQYVTHVIRHDGPLSLAGTSVFLNRVVNEEFEKILRIKGLAGFREKGGKPALLHAVQNKFYPVEWLPDWPDDDTTARLVSIGRTLDTTRIDELFRSLCV